MIIDTYVTIYNTLKIDNDISFVTTESNEQYTLKFKFQRKSDWVFEDTEDIVYTLKAVFKTKYSVPCIKQLTEEFKVNVPASVLENEGNLKIGLILEAVQNGGDPIIIKNTKYFIVPIEDGARAYSQEEEEPEE